MASILRYSTTPKYYEPCPRMWHRAAHIGDKLYMWGGRTAESSRKKLTSVVEIYDPYFEAWQQEATTGVSPPGLYGGGCTSANESLLWYGGYDGKSRFGTLHQLNTASLNWEELYQRTPQGPIAKSACGLTFFQGNKAALFGGFGIPTGPTQPGSIFTKYTGSGGWTNEFHLFDLQEGVWSSPPTTGSRPPPCSHFTFTAIDSHRGVLFGGFSLEHGRMNDVHIINVQTMHWTKVDKSGGGPWPVGRTLHAACCLDYGEEHPQLLVSGGRDKDGNPLRDLWVLDVEAGTWKELAVSEVVQPRYGHTVTAFNFKAGLVEATMFGGSTKYVPGRDIDKQPKTAETTVLQLESVENPTHDYGASTREWILVDVAKGNQLGSTERIIEKTRMVRKQPKATTVATRTEHVGVGVEWQASQEERAATAEERANTAEERSTTTEERAATAEERAATTEERANTAEERSTTTEERATAAEERAATTQERAATAKERATTTQEKTNTAEERATTTDERATTTEERATTAEERATTAEERAITAEERATTAEERAITAEERTTTTEERATAAEERATTTEERATTAEERATTAEERATTAEERAITAEERATAAEERAITAEERATTAEERATTTEERLAQLEHRTHEAERVAEEANQRTQEAERRAEEAERRLQIEDKPSWAVGREEIQFTGEILGRGGWAEVRVTKFRGVRIAAKCLHKQIISPYNRDLFIREMNMAARVRHPNLLLFIGATLQGELTILTELMSTSLRALLEQGELPQQQLVSIACDIANALNYLHLMRPDPIIHRDVSSANVLLDHGYNNSWRAKLSDYGSVNFLRQVETVSPGNPTYAAPEATNPAQQSNKMDIFSFGVLLVEMCTARFPDPATREHSIRSIREPRLVGLVRQCTAVDKDRRPSAADLITRLTEL